MTKPVNIKELNLKIINKFSFQKKYFNFFIKKYKVKNYFITKRFKIRIPINKLCVFSKNINVKPIVVSPFFNPLPNFDNF